MSDDRCPCGSGNPYAACCQPYLDGHTQPTSPEQLMCSRYSAFYTGRIDYLIATHHPFQRQADDRQILANTIATTEWVGLRVIYSNATAEVGRVEFAAFYKRQGVIEQLHEKSEFIRQNDRWYYLHGTILEPIHFGRNDPCWCGSGKMYKKCHGA